MNIKSFSFHTCWKNFSSYCNNSWGMDEKGKIYFMDRLLTSITFLTIVFGLSKKKRSIYHGTHRNNGGKRKYQMITRKKKKFGGTWIVRTYFNSTESCPGQTEMKTFNSEWNIVFNRWIWFVVFCLLRQTTKELINYFFGLVNEWNASLFNFIL